MNELVAYVLEVVVVPAIVGASVAAPCLLGRLRGRRAVVEAAVASGLALAFALAFVAELDLRAVLRQVVTIEGDDAPFERWHRVGLVAVLLVPASWTVSAIRARLSEGRAALATVVATSVVGILVGIFVRFPGMTTGGQVALAAAVPLFAGMFWRARRDLGWAAWIVFGCLAAFAGIDGFASLAVMCGAISAAAFGVATLAAAGRMRADPSAPPAPALGGATFLVLGTLAAVIVACGTSYGTLGLGKLWWIPIFVVIGDELPEPLEKRVARVGAKALCRVVGMLLLAALAVGFATRDAGRSADDGAGGDDVLETYGG